MLNARYLPCAQGELILREVAATGADALGNPEDKNERGYRGSYWDAARQLYAIASGATLPPAEPAVLFDLLTAASEGTFLGASVKGSLAEMVEVNNLGAALALLMEGRAAAEWLKWKEELLEAQVWRSDQQGRPATFAFISSAQGGGCVTMVVCCPETFFRHGCGCCRSPVCGQRRAARGTSCGASGSARRRSGALRARAARQRTRVATPPPPLTRPPPRTRMLRHTGGTRTQRPRPRGTALLVRPPAPPPPPLPLTAFSFWH